MNNASAYKFILYYKILNNNMYINLIFFILLNIYSFYLTMSTCVYDTSTIMHISRPEGFWENSDYIQPLPEYGKVNLPENSLSELPGVVELPGDTCYRQDWNGLYMEEYKAPLEYSTATRDGDNPEIHHYGDRKNLYKSHSHYYSDHRNPYIIHPTLPKTQTSLITTIKNKIVKWGKELDKGTEEYIKNQKRWDRKMEENRRIRKSCKAYEKLYGKSAMDKLERAEQIYYYADKFKKKSKSKKIIY